MSIGRNTNVINVAQLEALSATFSSEKEGQSVIDLTSLGYAKLLGTGRITKPLMVKVQSCSKSAEEKMKQAGGKVLTASQELGE